MQQNYAFQPGAGPANTSDIAVTAASQTLTLNPSGGSDGGSVRIANIGSQTVFLAFGTSTASLTTSMPILAGTVEMFSLGGGITTLSVIAAAAGSIIYATVGTGI